MNRKDRAPASGEQAAITGFFKQYEFSAAVIFRLMQQGKFDGIAISDPTAGIFDDLVIFSDNQIIAHQVKTERYATTFALKTELLKNSVLNTIASSWSSLRNAYPKKNIELRYVFAGYPSTNDELADKDEDPPRHSAAFLEFLGNPDTNFDPSSLKLTKWAKFLVDLENASLLGENDFYSRLLPKLRILDYEELIRNSAESFEPSAKKKIEQIKTLIPTIIARRENKTIWTESEFVQELGWIKKERQQKFHEFPVDSDAQENVGVEEELLVAIRDNSNGYLSLIGPPGTGKSTTLQQAIHSCPEFGVARYLAFMPDQLHGLGRAEASDFLNDITFDLNKLGFTGSAYVDDSISILQNDFQRQLGEAHNRFKETGRKTVILVDGLDHITREERPERSLLREGLINSR